MSEAKIEAMKARVEEHLEDAEAAHRAYETWMINWRIRMAAKMRDAFGDAALSEGGKAGAA